MHVKNQKCIMQAGIHVKSYCNRQLSATVSSNLITEY